MRWKSLLITIVLNIFLMLFASLLLEYNHLTDRFMSLEDTISTSVDSAVKLSVSSEEFFGADAQSLLSSHSVSLKDISSKRQLSSQIVIWNETSKKFDRINLYALAKYYESKTGSFADKFPTKGTDIGTAQDILGNKSKNTTAQVFGWLYGGIGQSYTDSSLSWSSKNTNKLEEYASIGSARGANFASVTPERSSLNSNFKAWVDGVGKHQYTVGILKKKVTGDATAGVPDSYELATVAYPTIANMGLKLGSYSITTEEGDSTANLNDVTSDYTNDNFTSSFKVGKGSNKSGGQVKTVYYLTPQSLGLTYIPPEVLKPSVLANLLNTIHLNKISGSNGWRDNSVSADAINSAKGCIETNVYSGTDASNHQQHVVATNEANCIYNDGNVEYDMNSVKCKVDYMDVDFSQATDATDDPYATLFTKLNGQIAGYTQSEGEITSKSAPTWGTADKQRELRKLTLNSFLDMDKDSISYVGNGADDFGYLDALTESVRNTRIVARVNVKVKVHIPYQSSILQWFCYRFKDGGSSGHYSIKLWDSKNGKIDKTNDGLWYSYTTYFMTSRN